MVHFQKEQNWCNDVHIFLFIKIWIILARLLKYVFGSVGVFSGITPKLNSSISDLHPLSDFYDINILMTEQFSTANYFSHLLMTGNGEQPNRSSWEIFLIQWGGGITGQLARYSLKYSIYLYFGHYGTGDYGTPRKQQNDAKIKIFC